MMERIEAQISIFDFKFWIKSLTKISFTTFCYLDNCVDQSNCNPDLPDQSWSSVMGATLALVAPLSVLLALILMIKFCFINMYPKGYHESVDENRTNKNRIPQEKISSSEDKNERQVYQIA